MTELLSEIGWRILNLSGFDATQIRIYDLANGTNISVEIGARVVVACLIVFAIAITVIGLLDHE